MRTRGWSGGSFKSGWMAWREVRLQVLQRRKMKQTEDELLRILCPLGASRGILHNLLHRWLGSSLFRLHFSCCSPSRLPRPMDVHTTFFISTNKHAPILHVSNRGVLGELCSRSESLWC